MAIKNIDKNKIERQDLKKNTEIPIENLSQQNEISLDSSTIITENIDTNNENTSIDNNNDDNINNQPNNIENENKQNNETINFNKINKQNEIISEKYAVSAKTKNISTFGIFSIIFFILIIILTISYLIYTHINFNSTNIISGISIKEIDVSGLTKQQAKEKLEKYINNNLPENINLKHLDYETSIPLSSLDISFDLDTAINKAYSIGRNGNFLENGIAIFKTKFSNLNIEPDVTINEEQLKISLNDISSKLPDKVVDNSYYIEDSNLIITRGKEGSIVNINQMMSYIKNGIINLTLNNRTLNIATQTKQPSAINVEKIHKEIYKEPVNAYFTQNPYTIYPHENGLDFAISLDEAKSIIESEEKDEYTIPLKTLYPNITTNMLGSEAFPDLLSTFSTKYAASNKNRTTNLILAANKINGTILMPGETFSYNKVVGARTIEAGYKEAPIYVSGEVVDGLGGGICQITSTLYNAVVYANLEIIQRSNHQFVPSYVTASRDATVVYGAIDFQFKNNRDYPIKIQCSVSNGIANFQIYGLKRESDYEVVISSYETGRTANAIYSEAYKILKQNGQEIKRELLSKDVYKRH